ncbi:hypothetical protein Tco_0842909 [Tanacetum coccineum]|uniref:Uncharacterized protein n=1 Tax=Tanacetum coccineum TaxID=301880 RepID=A0ABQ5B2T1_9ASTR
MVIVPIHQASALVPPLFTPVIDISSPPKPASSTTQAPIFTTTTTTTTTTLPPPPQQQSTTESELVEHKMADENIPATAPTIYDDQILPFAAWVPIRKSNYVLVFTKKSKNHSYRFMDNLPKHNVFRASTAQIPHSSVCVKLVGDAIMDFVNELGYPEERLLDMIGPDIQFVRCSRELLQVLMLTMLNLYPASLFHLAEDLRLGNLKFVPKGKEDEVFGMPIPNELISHNIRNAPYYNAYLEMVAKHDQKVAAEKEENKKTASVKQPKSKSATEKSCKPAPASKPKTAKEKPSKPSIAKPPKLKPFKENQAHVGGVAIREPVAEATRPLPVVEGKGKAIVTEEQVPITESIVDKQVNLEEKTAELDQDQAGLNLEIWEDAYSIGDRFITMKSTEDETRNTQRWKHKWVFTLELRDLPHKIDETVLETVKEAIQSGTYKSLPEHVALYEALEASMAQAQRDEFLAEKDKSCKRCPPQSSTWKKSDTGDTPSSSSKQQSGHHSEQPVKDIPMPYTANISDSEDTDYAHLPKTKQRPEWLKPIPEEYRPTTPEPDWSIPMNDLPELENNWANALAKSYKDPKENKLLRKTEDMGSFITWFCKRIRKKKLSKSNLEGPSFKAIDFGSEELVPSLWIKSGREYDISVVYGNSHWWFKRKEFYIIRHSAPFDRTKVRSHMRILSVVSLKTLERYGYAYLKEIVLRRADYKEYKISKVDFKNLHPNDFEDLYLLHLQGQLNHLSDDDKVHLFNAVNLWIRNIIIRKRVEDLQLGIEIIKPRAVIYRDKNDQKKMMRETKVHKFNDGTLNRILDKLDHMVKDFKLYEYNKGMET